MGLQLGHKVAAIIASLLSAFQSQAQQYTEKNQRWEPENGSAYFILLKHQKNCLWCFNEVFETIHKDFSGPGHTVASVSLVDSSVFARKMEASTIRELMPGISHILFEYRNNNDVGKSWFNTYSPDVTPALVVINKGRRAYVPYDSIYPEGKINQQLRDVLHRAMQ